MADDGLTHFDDAGRPRMVDVTTKDVTARMAVAEGRIVMDAATLARIRDGRSPKGDPLLVAQVAGIMGGKRTADLIPLCHPLPGTSVEVTLEPDEALPGVVARAEARVAGRTGVEMEALTAVSVALLAIYDMVKAVDRGMRIEGVRLLHKEGGESGTWRADPPTAPRDDPAEEVG
jgi:cyclic pyranopterin phosphate synthase